MNFNAIKELLAPYDGDNPGCAVTVSHKGIELFNYVAGYGDLEHKIPITNQSNFRLASVTKQFTAIGILVLIQDGLLSLNTKLTEFFLDFPEYGKYISVYQLLTHTSGIQNYEELMEKDGIQISDNQVLELLSHQTEGYFKPGTKYRYSNGGYCLLKLIIEKVSGKSFGAFMREKLFSPLGMGNTYVNEEGLGRIPNRAYGYSYRSGVPIRTDQDATSATVGDGGVYSSIMDLTKWNRVFYSDVILTEQSRKMIFEKYVTTDEDDNSSYGFGLFLKKHNDEEIAYHGGSSIGFRTGMYTIPAKELTVFFLSNRTGGNGAKTTEKIADIILAQV